MKEIYLLRHAEKDTTGSITEQGRRVCLALADSLPAFNHVYSSPSERATLTAELISHKEPVVDERAGFYMASQGKSDAINKLANDKQIPFLDAVVEFGDEEVTNGVTSKASGLNEMIDTILSCLNPNGIALIVSHDLSISPAMQQRGIPLESIGFLSGYIIRDDGSVSRYTPSPA